MMPRHPNEPHWSTARCQLNQVPASLLSWLNEKKSMTRRMQQNTPQLSIDVILEAWQRPLLSEASALNLNSHVRCWIRQVLIRAGNSPWMLARAVVPLKTIKGPGQPIKHLDTRPLGEFLFHYPDMQRLPFEWTHLNAKTGLMLWPTLKNKYFDQSVWTRRSIFLLSEQPLLLTEAFLPALVKMSESQ